MRYFDSFEDENDIFVILKYIGKKVVAFLWREKTEDYLTNRMMEQMLIALCFLNKHRILHRDINPETIFLKEDGNAMLGDFECTK